MALSSPRIAFLVFGSIVATTTLGFARLWATGMIRAGDPTASVPPEMGLTAEDLDSASGQPARTTYSGSRGV